MRRLHQGRLRLRFLLGHRHVHAGKLARTDLWFLPERPVGVQLVRRRVRNPRGGRAGSEPARREPRSQGTEHRLRGTDGVYLRRLRRGKLLLVRGFGGRRHLPLFGERRGLVRHDRGRRERMSRPLRGPRRNLRRDRRLLQRRVLRVGQRSRGSGPRLLRLNRGLDESVVSTSVGSRHCPLLRASGEGRHGTGRRWSGCGRRRDAHHRHGHGAHLRRRGSDRGPRQRTADGQYVDRGRGGRRPRKRRDRRRLGHRAHAGEGVSLSRAAREGGKPRLTRRRNHAWPTVPTFTGTCAAGTAGAVAVAACASAACRARRAAFSSAFWRRLPAAPLYAGLPSLSA